MGKYTGILLVSDWDRTVTGPDRKVPPANTEAVLRFMEGGGLLSIATGHTRVSHRSRWAELPTNSPHIVFNGAEIYDYATERSLWQGPLPESAEGLFASLLEKHPELHFEIQCPTETYVFGQDMGLAEIMKKMGGPHPGFAAGKGSLPPHPVRRLRQPRFFPQGGAWGKGAGLVPLFQRGDRPSFRRHRR